MAGTIRSRNKYKPYLIYFKGILNKYYSGELENAIPLQCSTEDIRIGKNEEYIIKCRLASVEMPYQSENR
jgi:hypothetical protein